MKNLEALIEKTTTFSERKLKKDDTESNKSLAEKIFKLADEVTDKLDNAVKNGVKRPVAKQKHVFKNITFSMPAETEMLLNELVKRFMLKTGEIGKKSHIICAALDMIKELDSKSFIDAVAQKKNLYK